MSNLQDTIDPCPCYQCGERVAAPPCHSRCADYLEWAKTRDLQKAAIRKKREQENMWLTTGKHR